MQLQYDGSDTFDALFNVHARHLNGTARLFRANIFKPGTNELVDGFDRDEGRDRWPQLPGARHLRRQRAPGLGARNDLSLFSITGYESAEIAAAGATSTADSAPCSRRRPAPA